MKKLALLTAGAALSAPQLLLAAAADPATITSGANTAFEAVSAVLVTVALFFTVLYYARKAKGR